MDLPVLGRLGGRTDLEPIHAPERAGEVQRIALDAGAARRELSWSAETGIEAGLATTLESIRSGA